MNMIVLGDLLRSYGIDIETIYKEDIETRASLARIGPRSDEHSPELEMSQLLVWYYSVFYTSATGCMLQTEVFSPRVHSDSCSVF
jgi:hypothetical protein